MSRILERARRVPGRIRSQLLRPRVLALKRERQKHKYDTAPKVTAILQCYNKADALPKLLERIHIPEVQEIIAIDDGSADSTLSVLVRALRKPNHFVLHANDLFEIRTYNRALRMATGELIALLQDDDLPPEGSAWVENAQKLFDLDPRLAVLGGRDGLDLLLPDPAPSDGKTEYRIVNDVGGTPGIHKYRLWRSSQLDSGVRYVMAVNRAPMWVRRSAVVELGYIDDAFAPFQCDDVDLCVRAWLAGWRVGLYAGRFTYLTQGGMRLYNVGASAQQVARNWPEIYRRYGQQIGDNRLSKLVEDANGSLG